MVNRLILTATATALLLTACSSGDSDTPQLDQNKTAKSASTASGNDSGGTSAEPTGGATSSSKKATPTQVGASRDSASKGSPKGSKADNQNAKHRTAAQLKALEQMPGYDPSVQWPRIAEEIDSVNHAFINGLCIMNEGWPGSKIDQKTGKVNHSVPAKKRSEFNKIAIQCAAMYPLSAKKAEPVSPESDAAGSTFKGLKANYDFYVSDVKPCYEKLGKNTGKVPSFEKWAVDAVFNQKDAWHPGDVATKGLSDEAASKLREQCPEAP